jgi:hypothetical protein
VLWFSRWRWNASLIESNVAFQGLCKVGGLVLECPRFQLEATFPSVRKG